MAPSPSGTAMTIAGGTGLDPVAVEVWIRCEGGPGDNPLNIGPGQHPGIGGTIAEINNGTNWGGIRAARGQPAAAQLAAIKASPWDEGHYANGCLERTLGSALGGAPAAPAPASSSSGGVTGDIASLVDQSIAAALGAPAGETTAQWLAEHAIRVAEVLGGATVFAVGLMMLLELVSTPAGSTAGGIVRKGARTGRKLTEAVLAAVAL